MTSSPILAPTELKQIIAIHTHNTSMVLRVEENKELCLLAYGGKIEDESAFLFYQEDKMTRHAYTTRGGRECKEPALAIRHANGKLNTILKYAGHQQEDLQEGVTQTTVHMVDSLAQIEVDLLYTAYEKEDVIACHSIIRNGSEEAIELDNYYSSQLSLNAPDYHLYHFNGMWNYEMSMNHTHLSQGTTSIECKRLIQGAITENPSFILTLKDKFAEESGEVIMGALAWNGNYKINFEIDEYGRLHILSGINPYSARITLEAQTCLTTPSMMYTHSPHGVGLASRRMHDWARGHGIWKGYRLRPTLLNSWEGAYFTFDTQTILKMIDDTAAMGLEMFVLDDGWFGNKYPRNNDKVGLGDWQVNEEKLPEGIAYLAEYAHQKGVKFGIWIEPEMVNPQSELAEQHPEWIVGERGRNFPQKRSQLLLDLSNPEVQDFVFETFDNTLSLSPLISYIKWDANRHLENIGSTYLLEEEQEHFTLAYTQGLLSVYERIRAKYPHVMIQACASGGGRVEYGTLKYHDEAWSSDNTDALSRAFIQYGMNMVYPAIITGSHVSAVPNHRSDNVTPLKFRFDMAMSGRLGMELQPQDMTEAEREEARGYIQNYHAVRDIVFWGDLYRLSSPYGQSGYYALMYVSKDKKRALVFLYVLSFLALKKSPVLQLRGLQEGARYRLREMNVEQSMFWAHDKTLSADFLQKQGLSPKLRRLFSSGVYLLEME